MQCVFELDETVVAGTTVTKTSQDSSTPKWSIVFTELPWASIGVCSVKTRPQTFHARSKLEKKIKHTSGGKPGGPIGHMHVLEERMEKGVIDTTVLASSVRLAEEAVDASTTIQKAMYALSWLKKIWFLFVFRKARAQARWGACLVRTFSAHRSAIQQQACSRRQNLQSRHSFADMKVLLELGFAVLQHGVHRRIFCSVLPPGACYRELCKNITVQEETTRPGSHSNEE